MAAGIRIGMPQMARILTQIVWTDDAIRKALLNHHIILTFQTEIKSFIYS